MKKVLIVIADIGNGHKSAADAITSMFIQKYSGDYSVKTIDLYKEADIEPFNSADISYKFLSQNKAYEKVSNLIWNFTNTRLGYFFYKKYFLGLIYKAASEVIKKENPDIVISAYPLTSTVINQMRVDGSNFKYAVVITDLVTMHRSWADNSADLITCPTPDAVNTLVKFGVDINKVIYPFFPLKPELKNFRSNDQVLEELGFNSNLPVILLTGGGLGTKAIKQAIQKLANKQSLQLIVVAGRLSEFKKELDDIYGSNKNIKILGFVNNMYDYLNVCDIVIGKPGATTVSEIELFNKKAIFTRYIGVHDYGNVEYALRDPKIEYIGDDFSKLDQSLEKLLNFEPRDSDLKLKRNFNEVETIVKEIVKLVE
jgi:UDP-N-acetylglucosamine:LPS N-acetylglucosamine transferase